MSTFTSILELFILILIGYTLGYFSILSSSAEKDLPKLLILVITPATIINSMSIPFDTGILFSSIKVLIYAFSFQLLGLFLGVILSKVLKLNSTEKPIYIIALMISNVGNMGIPVISSILGSQYVFYLSLIIMTSNILLYTVGMFIMTSSSNQKLIFKDKIIELIKVPPVIATIIGLFIFLFEIPIPNIIGNTLLTLSSVMTPLAMIIIGLILSNAPIKSIFYNFNIHILILFKLLILPIIMICICLITNLDDDLSQFLVLVTGMPSAAMTAILAARYDKNKIFASQVVFVTTTLTIFTIPILTAVSQYIW